MNVWPLHSQSACFQVSTVLFYAQTTKFVWAQICGDDVHVSCLQAKDWRHHLSQNIGLVVAGSARPALLALICTVCMQEKGASEGSEHVKSLALGPVFIITRFTVNT